MAKQWFEFLLSILTNRQRAAEMTGDLLEQHSGGLRFWWFALRLLTTLTWRPVLGVAGALVVFLLAGIPFGLVWQRANGPMPHTHWQWLAFRTVPYSMFAWAIACMALVKCGIRSGTSVLACVLAAMITFESCALASPPLQMAAISAFFIVVLGGLLTPEARASIGALVRGAIAVGIVATAWNQAYAALLAWGKLPAGPGVPLTFSSLLLAFVAGWLAMDTPWKRAPQPRDGAGHVATS